MWGVSQRGGGGWGRAGVVLVLWGMAAPGARSGSVQTLAGINLLPNPSFEHGLAFKQQVDDWIPAPEFPDAEYTWDAEEKHTGEHSLRIHASLKPDGTWANAGWASPAFPAFAGIRYTFSAWIKTSSTAGHTHLVLAWFNAQHQWLGNTDNGFFLHGLNDWLQVSVSDYPPDGAAYGRAYFRSDGNGGMAWVDDVRLSLSEEAEGEILVPNASVEAASQEGPDGWEAEGTGEVVEGEALAHTGRCCVALTDAVGEAAWVSPAFYLHASRRYVYRFSAWVSSEEMEAGEASVSIRWMDEAGGFSEAEGEAVAAGQAGWVEAVVEAVPPEGTVCGRLRLRGEDVVGEVWFDDVALQVRPVEGGALPTPTVPLGVAIARCYGAHVVSPDRLREHFQETFPRAEEVERVLADVEGYMAAQAEAVDNELKWMLGVLRYHAGRSDAALDVLRPLHRAYDMNDVRNDAVWHYEYWAEEGRKEQERQTRLKALDEQAKAAGNGSTQEQVRTWQQVADGYYEVQAFEQAAQAYQRLEQVAVAAGEADRASYAAYRIGVARSQAGDYGGAVEALEAFLQTYPESEWLPEATFWLGESYRRQGQPREAISILKPLWEREPTGDLAKRVDRSLTQCYMALREDSALVEEYKRFFGRPALPGALYVGEDWETQGDWPGHYGTYVYVLCGMQHYNLVGGPGWPLSLRLYTTDPAERGRRYIAALESDDPAELYNPVSRRRRPAHWDDRGEVYSGRGPDLLFDLNIPSGVFLLSLYAREHRIQLRERDGVVLATAPRTPREDNRYRRFVVFGPLELTIHIYREESLAALLHGVFLDKLAPPVGLESLGLSRTVEAPVWARALALYEARRQAWVDDVERYYQQLSYLEELRRAIDDTLSASPAAAFVPAGHLLRWQGCLQLWDWSGAAAAMAAYLRTLAAAADPLQAAAQLKQLAALCQTQGWPRSERQVLEALVALEPDSSEQTARQERLGYLYQLLGDDDAHAVQIYTHLADLEPDPEQAGWALYQASSLLLTRGETEEAQLLLQRIMQTSPQTPAAAFAQQHLSAAQGRTGGNPR